MHTAVLCDARAPALAGGGVLAADAPLSAPVSRRLPDCGRRQVVRRSQMQHPHGSAGGSPSKLHALTGALSSSSPSLLVPLDEQRRSPPRERQPFELARYDPPPASSAKYRTSLPTIIEPDGISPSVVRRASATVLQLLPRARRASRPDALAHD
jgi:hypothetical protein